MPRARGVFSILPGMQVPRNVLFLLLLAWNLCLVRNTHLSGQVPVNDPHWNLIFREQFDSLDLDTWKVAHHFDHYGEPQVYTHRPVNVYLEKGKLVLQVRKESYRCDDLRGNACNKSRYDYTSGWVETRTPAFGFLEARIRIPHGYGFWPAFWTFVSAGPSERHNAAEIDIFEMLGTQPSHIMGTNLHIDYCGCNDNECHCEYLNDMRCPEVNPEILCHGLDVLIPDYKDIYHTYAVEWTPSKIIWYVNGQMVRNSFNPGIVDPVRVIFNLAIAPWSLPDRTTPFPSSMYIDFLNIYQLQEVPPKVVLGCRSTDERGVEDDTLQIDRIMVNENITFRATEEIEISGEFTVPLGAELYLDVNPSYPTSDIEK